MWFHKHDTDSLLIKKKAETVKFQKRKLSLFVWGVENMLFNFQGKTTEEAIHFQSKSISFYFSCYCVVVFGWLINCSFFLTWNIDKSEFDGRNPEFKKMKKLLH